VLNVEGKSITRKYIFLEVIDNAITNNVGIRKKAWGVEMKLVQKGNLNIGVQAFILNREFFAKIAIQQKPITWDWETNIIAEAKISPILLRDKKELNEWNKQFTYMVFYEGKEMFASHDWEKALETAEYHINRIGSKVGLPHIDLQKQFIKNEPKITFSEIYSILKKLGVKFE